MGLETKGVGACNQPFHLMIETDRFPKWGSLEYQMMEKVKKLSNPESNIFMKFNE